MTSTIHSRQSSTQALHIPKFDLSHTVSLEGMDKMRESINFQTMYFRVKHLTLLFDRCMELLNLSL